MSSNPKKIVICATQRSGSTLICNDLVNSGIGSPGEYFLRWVKQADSADDSVDKNEILEQVKAAGMGSNGTFAVKIMSQYCDRVNTLFQDLGYGTDTTKLWAGVAEYFEDSVWVYCRRNSIIRQAVSRYVLHQTGIAHAISSKSDGYVPASSHENINRNYSKDVGYNPGAIAQRTLDIVKENLKWEIFFKENNITPIEIVYEEFTKDTSYINKILEQLGLEKQNEDRLVRNLVKIANENSEKIIRRFLDEPLNINKERKIESLSKRNINLRIRANFLEGELWRNKNRPFEAAKYYERVLRIDPTHPKAKKAQQYLHQSMQTEDIAERS